MKVKLLHIIMLKNDYQIRKTFFCTLDSDSVFTPFDKLLITLLIILDIQLYKKKREKYVKLLSGHELVEPSNNIK